MGVLGSPNSIDSDTNVSTALLHFSNLYGHRRHESIKLLYCNKQLSWQLYDGECCLGRAPLLIFIHLYSLTDNSIWSGGELFSPLRLLYWILLTVRKAPVWLMDFWSFCNAVFLGNIHARIEPSMLRCMGLQNRLNCSFSRLTNALYALAKTLLTLYLRRVSPLYPNTY